MTKQATREDRQMIHDRCEKAIRKTINEQLKMTADEFGDSAVLSAKLPSIARFRSAQVGSPVNAEALNVGPSACKYPSPRIIRRRAPAV